MSGEAVGGEQSLGDGLSLARHVTVVVVAWGSMPLLRQCITAILESRTVTTDVVVVDNGCTDGSVDDLPKDDRVQVLRPGSNLGFAGGCNLGAGAASGDVVAFINPDAVVDASALCALATALDDREIGIATARLRLLDQPDLLNSSGGSLHFLGLGWANGFGVPAASECDQRPVTNASGASMAMRTELFRRVGGFTPELFLYHEDCELSLRIWLLGFRVELIPGADVWHDYHFARNSEKYYFLERNRLIIVASIYERRTLLLLAPALGFLELGLFVLAALQGWFPEKVRGWRWLIAHRKWLVEHRRRIQGERIVRDRDLVPLLSARFDAGQLSLPASAKPVDWLLSQYWRVVLHGL